MRGIIQTALKSILLFTVLCGVFYTIIVTVVGQVVFPDQANGSLIKKTINGETLVIGSKLIGQSFTEDHYLHGRPMQVSQLSPVSEAQKDRIAQRVAQSPDAKQTIDLVTASASGIDPEITVEGALMQVDRLALARNMKKEEVRAIIKKNMSGISFGLVNTQRVNVLAVNQQLDESE